MNILILFIQRVLNSNGIKCGKPDGIFGSKTDAAINLFLNEQNVNASDWPIDRRIVAAVQLICNIQNQSYKLEIDGYFGHNTDFAFEQNNTYLQNGALPQPFRNKPETSFPTDIPHYDWGKGDSDSVIKLFGDPYATDFQQTQLTLIDLPYELRIAWNMNQKTSKMRVHNLVKNQILAILNDVLITYGLEHINSLGLNRFGGCYMLRKMRGGNQLSLHSYAIAFDFDPARNALRTPWSKSQFSSPIYSKWIEIWYDHGFINLGKEMNYDSMHFQPNFKM